MTLPRLPQCASIGDTDSGVPFFCLLLLGKQQKKVRRRAHTPANSSNPSVIMIQLTATEARANLYRLIDQVAETSEPIVITGKRASAVLVSQNDWNAIQESLHLLSLPDMRESIRTGMAEAVDQCATVPDW